MVRGSELALVLAVCDESTGQLVPLKFGYLRIHVEATGGMFLAITPVDTSVQPIAVNLDLEMTIGEAIDTIGPDGADIVEWLQCGAA